MKMMSRAVVVAFLWLWLAVTAHAQTVAFGNGTIAAGTLNAAFSVAPIGGGGSADWQITGLASSGATLTPEFSDDGSTWFAANVNVGGSSVATITADGIAAQQFFRHVQIRLRVSTPGTGTITVHFVVSSSSQDPLNIGGGGGGGGGGPVTQSTVPWIVKPGPFTIVPLDISVTGSPGAVTVLNAGHATAGGNLVTANASGMCVDENTTAGTVTGTPSSTICVAQNQAVALTPTSGAVSVNSTGSAVRIGGTGLQ